MSKHTRLVVTILFAVMIVLAVAITRFYVGTRGSSSGKKEQGSIERYLSAPDGDGSRIFEDKNGLCGIADSSGRVTAAPEWVELSFAGSGKCIASRRVGGRILTGCIDYEGNAVVPFIYSSIEKYSPAGQTFFIARSDTDGSCVVYSDDFDPLLGGAWDGAELSGTELTLTDGSDEFTYTCTEDGCVLTGASVSGETLGCAFTLSVDDEQLLAGLSPAKLKKIVSVTGIWLDFAYTGSDAFYTAVQPSNWVNFTSLFPKEERITSRKLLSLTGAKLTALAPDGGVPRYEFTLSTDTQIDYTDAGRDKTMRGAYTAAAVFRGSYDSSFEAVTGAFDADVPAYPEVPAQPENKEEIQ
ncbi:MAG: hypothetical protein IJM44_03975 [Ruminococcus sp.]|nr:hypothetical protein [Ruminococcus sp.]